MAKTQEKKPEKNLKKKYGKNPEKNPEMNMGKKQENDSGKYLGESEEYPGESGKPGESSIIYQTMNPRDQLFCDKCDYKGLSMASIMGYG